MYLSYNCERSRTPGQNVEENVACVTSLHQHTKENCSTSSSNRNDCVCYLNWRAKYLFNALVLVFEVCFGHVCDDSSMKTVNISWRVSSCPQLFVFRFGPQQSVQREGCGDSEGHPRPHWRWRSHHRKTKCLYNTKWVRAINCQLFRHTYAHNATILYLRAHVRKENVAESFTLR